MECQRRIAASVYNASTAVVSSFAWTAGATAPARTTQTKGRAEFANHNISVSMAVASVSAWTVEGKAHAHIKQTK